MSKDPEEMELSEWLKWAARHIPQIEYDNERLQAENAALREALLLAQEKLSFYNGEYRGGPHIKTVNDAIIKALGK